MKSITDKIRAGYPGIIIVSFEEQRVEAMLKNIADSLELGYGLHAWSCTTGRVDTRSGQAFGEQDPTEVLAAVYGMPEKSVLLLRDFHLFLKDPNPILYRMVKDALLHAKTANKTIVILAPVLELPVELLKLFVVEDFKLPDRSELQTVLANLCESTGKPLPVNGTMEAVLDSSLGLTTTEAEDAFALSLIESGTFSPTVISREKAAAVKKNGLLDFVESKNNMNDIGGLDILKSWMLKRKMALSKNAREYGIPMPKGVLIVGIPGCGKSLTAKAAAAGLGYPLLKLDCGKIFGSLVGQSEQNLRSIIQTAESVAPCVLWMDEIEKGMGGGSGDTDGGTSSRVFGSFLQWMNDKTSPVFIVATANDISKLKPEFLRKGRFDEIFFVDLPDASEREEIWRVQISKFRRDPDAFDLPKLASITDGCTGSEIESLFTDALYSGMERGEEPTENDISNALQSFVPLSKTMETSMKNLRDWSVGKARPATTKTVPAVKQTTNTRKLSV